MRPNSRKSMKALRLCSRINARDLQICKTPPPESSHDSRRTFLGRTPGRPENRFWGPSWAMLGQLGGKLGYLGCILGHLEPMLGIMWAHLWVVLAFLGPRHAVQADFGPNIPPKWCPMGPKMVRSGPKEGLQNGRRGSTLISCLRYAKSSARSSAS